MKSSHRFPLRRQIVWGMRFFTFLTSLAVGAALFILSNQYVRANSLQAAEFNLRLVATSIETSLESADALLNWASIDSTVRRYISQENINGTQTIAAYEAMQEKYYSSTLYSHILRFFVTNENDRHLQFGPLNSSAALNRTSVTGCSSPPTRCCPAVRAASPSASLSAAARAPCTGAAPTLRWIPPLSPTRQQVTA